MSSWPLLIEARIPEFAAIQGANLYSFIFQIKQHASIFFSLSSNINFVSVFGLSTTGSLIRQSMSERLIRRSLRQIPNMRTTPVAAPGFRHG